MYQSSNPEVSTVGITGEGPEVWVWLHPPLDIPESDVLFEHRICTEDQLQLSSGRDNPVSLIKFDCPDNQGRSAHEQAVAAAQAIANLLPLHRGAAVEIDSSSADALAA